MQFNVTTDYTIRTILDLASSGGKRTASEVAESMGIPQNYLAKIFKKLLDGGLVKVVRGRNGGYRLNRPAEEISLYDVISLSEKTLKLNYCLEEDHKCLRDINSFCSVKKVYEGIQEQVEDTLKSQKISDLITNMK